MRSKTVELVAARTNGSINNVVAEETTENVGNVLQATSRPKASPLGSKVVHALQKRRVALGGIPTFAQVFVLVRRVQDHEPARRWNRRAEPVDESGHRRCFRVFTEIVMPSEGGEHNRDGGHVGSFLVANV